MPSDTWITNDIWYEPVLVFLPTGFLKQYIDYTMEKHMRS